MIWNPDEEYKGKSPWTSDGSDDQYKWYGRPTVVRTLLKEGLSLSKVNSLVKSVVRSETTPIRRLLVALSSPLDGKLDNFTDFFPLTSKKVFNDWKKEKLDTVDGMVTFLAVLRRSKDEDDRDRNSPPPSGEVWLSRLDVAPSDGEDKDDI